MKGSIYLLKYSKGSKFFHWIIAFIVIAMLFSFYLDDLPEKFQGSAYMIHKSLGLTVLLLVIARFFWLLNTGKPPLPLTVPHWQKTLSRMIHYSFYVFLIAMPLSGWIMSVAADRIPSYFGLFSVPLPIEKNPELAKLMNQSHKIIAWVLVVLVILHVLGAIKHHYIDKDNVLKRMLPGG